MTGFRFIAALFSLTVCSLTGCTTLMQGAPLPEGFAVKDIAKADADTPFAVNRSGAFAAISKGAIQMIPPDGKGREIAQGTATSLCFSPSGDKLAAALPAEGKTLLRLFDKDGKLLAETTIADRVTSMVWRSESQLMATAVSMTKFSFGAGLSSRLYLWDGATTPVATDLAYVTMRPALAKVPDEALFNTLNMAISPYGDEIAYSSLKDPPLFTPYQRIAVRHIESGAERDVTQTSLGSRGLIYTPDGESLLVGDSHALTRRLSISDGKEMDAWPSAGNSAALSPSGSYLFLDGRLYQNGRTILSFPSQARGTFLPDGSGLAISYDGKLYLVSGLKDPAARPLPADLERLLKLRRLRSLGLITEKEYRAQKDKASAL